MDEKKVIAALENMMIEYLPADDGYQALAYAVARLRNPGIECEEEHIAGLEESVLGELGIPPWH